MTALLISNGPRFGPQHVSVPRSSEVKNTGAQRTREGPFHSPTVRAEPKGGHFDWQNQTFMEKPKFLDNNGNKRGKMRKLG